MNVYKTISERYKKFVKYMLVIFVISLIGFLITVAINKNNSVMNGVSMFFLTLACCSIIEVPILFIMSKVLAKKAEKEEKDKKNS